ncbi:hypothetical protein EVAR_10106_1 [Eumeta japonica]|uniref:Uncharacterized protein n=1 Tax=Eumeta variegata TaxID=151549 RepID=A0A4C1UC19_EUMVA|nr:hypothetical protein EVAR_10106_1 [Eumeta japonica]
MATGIEIQNGNGERSSAGKKIQQRRDVTTTTVFHFSRRRHGGCRCRLRRRAAFDKSLCRDLIAPPLCHGPVRHSSAGVAETKAIS